MRIFPLQRSLYNFKFSQIIQILEIIMEKGFKNITNTQNRPPANRIQQIEQKLKLITQARFTQARQEKTTILNGRVSKLEKMSGQLVRNFETQIRQQKQFLKELTCQYEQNKSQQDVSLRNRIAQVTQLQTRLANLWKAEEQRTRQYEKKAIFIYEEKIEVLRAQLQKVIERRKQYFLELDRNLSAKLPVLQTEINQKMNQCSDKLIRIQNQIEKQTEDVCKQIKQGQTKQISSFEQLMKIVGSVIAEIKQQIAEEKSCRSVSQKKLVNLFEGVISKLSA